MLTHISSIMNHEMSQQLNIKAKAEDTVVAMVEEVEEAGAVTQAGDVGKARALTIQTSNTIHQQNGGL
jgi:hypothetical protein